jgi:2,3-bisphosphoglycerate-independent phosphoglycerate mutase
MDSSAHKKQIALIVLDGWGHRDDAHDNAIAEAKTPFFDSLIAQYPHTTLDASEENVGLPSGQIGNSEVGHMTIGAGKVIDTDLVRITKAMKAGEFLTNPAMKTVFDHVKKHGSTLHLMGLVSPGGIHSHEEHLYGLLRAAKDAGVTSVAIHAFTDGRDVPPQSAAKSLQALEDLCTELGVGRVATISGRLYAMDRDNNWDRVELVTNALWNGKGESEYAYDMKPSSVVKEMYAKELFDEHIKPVVFFDKEGSATTLKQNDGVIFFNFRPDRARQLSILIAKDVEKMNLSFCTLTEYHPDLKAHVAFAPSKIDTTLAAEIANAGLTQAHIAETEKYPHATYFLNGGQEAPHTGEEFVLIESRKDVLTHDLAPEMRAKEIADAAIMRIENGVDFIFINFANADMVGHTAKKPAIITAVETVDRELGRVIGALKERGGIAFVTADHGNAEVNIDQHTHEKHTAHTLNQVPAIITETGHTMHSGSLADIAPTILDLYNLPIPAAMTGKKLTE